MINIDNVKWLLPNYPICSWLYTTQRQDLEGDLGMEYKKKKKLKFKAIQMQLSHFFYFLQFHFKINKNYSENKTFSSDKMSKSKNLAQNKWLANLNSIIMMINAWPNRFFTYTKKWKYTSYCVFSFISSFLYVFFILFCFVYLNQFWNCCQTWDTQKYFALNCCIDIVSTDYMNAKTMNRETG